MHLCPRVPRHPQDGTARGAGVLTSAGILVVLLGALSTFSYVTLVGCIIVLVGFVALGVVIIRTGVRDLKDVDGNGTA